VIDVPDAGGRRFGGLPSPSAHRREPKAGCAVRVSLPQASGERVSSGLKFKDLLHLPQRTFRWVAHADRMVRNDERDRQFEAFFAAESERLSRFGAFLTGDAEKGADLAQEAMARAYRKWDRIHDEPGSYCRRILVNLVRSRYRRDAVAKRHQYILGRARQEGSPSVEEWLRVRDALAQLTPIRRATVVLRFYEDLSEGEIAAILDRPLGTVKSDLHRAMKQLRPLLNDPVEEPSRIR
jgi:RNA polymerase sigma-70 factor (sigma-E family)